MFCVLFALKKINSKLSQKVSEVESCLFWRSKTLSYFPKKLMFSKKKKNFIIRIKDSFPLHLLTQIPLGFMAGHIAHLKNERY